MAMKVRYNGGTESYVSCSDPKNLVKGAVYEVVDKKVSDGHTEYTLAGVEGEYNSVWFDEVTDEKQVYMAISRRVPVVGKSYTCYKVNPTNKKVELNGCNTSTVKAVNYIGNDIYEVTTQNSTYIVKVCKS